MNTNINRPYYMHLYTVYLNLKFKNHENKLRIVRQRYIGDIRVVYLHKLCIETKNVSKMKKKTIYDQKY